MHFKGRIKLEEGFKQIFFVPFLNIVILLLLLFIFIGGFVLQPGLKLSLPVSVLSNMVPLRDIEVVIKGDSVVYLNSNMISLEELKLVFKESARRNYSLLIKADKNVPLGKVAQVCDLARLSGIAQVNLATN